MSKLGKPYDPVASTGRRRQELRLPDGRRRRDRLLRERRSSSRYMGSGALATAIDDFNADNFDHSGLGFIGGGSITVGPERRAADPEPERAAGHAAVRQRLEGRGQASTTTASSASASRASRRRTRPTSSISTRTTATTTAIRSCGSRSTGRPNERKMVAYAGTKLLEIMTGAIGRRDIVVRRPRLAAGPLRQRRRTSRPTTRAARSWAPTRHLGRQQLPADVGRAERVRRRGVQLPAERGLQPDGHGRRARLPGRRGHPQVPQGRAGVLA